MEAEFEALGGMGDEAEVAAEAFAGARTTLHQQLFELGVVIKN